MRKRYVGLSGLAGLVLVMGLVAGSLGGSTEQSPKLLTGDLWQRMSPDAKVAFVWGIGNLVEFERAQAGSQPAGSKSLIPLLVEGLRGKPINEVVRQIDAYYQTHPDRLKEPVMGAIFQAIVLPALKASKGGAK